MAFDQAAIKDLYSQISSPFKSMAAFKSFIPHEPKAAPTALPAVALWWNGIGPARGLSGLAATSARIEYRARIYVDFTKPNDEIEVQLQTLSSLVIGTFTAGFTLGGEAMEVDLLGKYGNPLSADPGYVPHDDHLYRVSECVLPVIVDGIWVQSP